MTAAVIAIVSCVIMAVAFVVGIVVWDAPGEVKALAVGTACAATAGIAAIVHVHVG